MNPHFFKTKFDEICFIAITLLGFIAFYVETDIYTPSFPQMMIFFQTNEDNIQKLLSMNFLGLCLSSLFFGPASDAFGRKKILCLGTFIFLVGSIGCTFTNSLNVMIGARFFQGIGCGAIVSAGLATFFDIFAPEKSSRLISVLNGIVGGMMALAPLIGNWITLHIGWRANFILIMFLTAMVFFCYLFFMRETLPANKRTTFHFSQIVKNYFLLCTNQHFMGYTLIWCLMFSMVIVFISNLSLVFIDYLGVSQEVFGYYQASIAGSFFVGSLSAAYLIKKLGMNVTKVLGSLIFMVGSFLLVFTSFLAPLPLALISGMVMCAIGSALAITLFFADSMLSVSEQLKGSAVSLTQSLRLSLSAGLVGIAAKGFDGTTKPMSLLVLITLGICGLIYFGLQRKKAAVSSDVVC